MLNSHIKSNEIGSFGEQSVLYRNELNKQNIDVSFNADCFPFISYISEKIVVYKWTLFEFAM